MAVPVAELAAATGTDIAESDDEADDEDVVVDDVVVDDDDDDEDDDDTAGSLGTDSTAPPTSVKRKGSEGDEANATGRSEKRARSRDDDDVGGPRQPHPASSSSGLTIPFRTIKRLMKSDPSVGIVQNEAAIVVTAALEHFVKKFALRSLEVARGQDRNLIKYEDVATARANDRSLSFLDLLIP
ncbi:hypothetical protein ACHAW5_008624 [Stephanodiscus triporus]|uniref:Transcription factor CBF/NF-Y/archaeal histone domain-containing protein n=1 Tax=Stephanodiscus triporus TaxID=2934178 RepID=A0ABD3QDU5_9STRA